MDNIDEAGGILDKFRKTDNDVQKIDVRRVTRLLEKSYIMLKADIITEYAEYIGKIIYKKGTYTFEDFYNKRISIEVKNNLLHANEAYIKINPNAEKCIVNLAPMSGLNKSIYDIHIELGQSFIQGFNNSLKVTTSAPTLETIENIISNVFLDCVKASFNSKFQTAYTLLYDNNNN